MLGTEGGRVEPETTTLDAVLGVALGIVAECFLDSKPDYTHWAGVGRPSHESRLVIGIFGVSPRGEDEGSKNRTVMLDTEFRDWVDKVLES